MSWTERKVARFHERLDQERKQRPEFDKSDERQPISERQLPTINGIGMVAVKDIDTMVDVVGEEITEDLHQLGFNQIDAVQSLVAQLVRDNKRDALVQELSTLGVES